MSGVAAGTDRLRSRSVVALGLLVLALGVLAGGRSLAEELLVHRATILAFVLAIASGELFRLRMPNGRDAAPLASASALAVVFVGRIDGEPDFDVTAGFVVLVVASGMLLAGVVRRAQGRRAGTERVAPRLVGVAVAAVLAREVRVQGRSLWDLALDRDVPRSAIAVAMVAVAAAGVVVDVVLTSAVRSERQRTPWLTALRGELGEVAPLTYAVVTSGPLVALMAPVFGLASLPAALFPLAITYVAVDRYAHNRVTYRQTIATLSHLTEKGGYTPRGHAERVAELSVRMGRVLGMPDRELRDVEYAALLHDLGQISLREPIPGGATVLAAPERPARHRRRGGEDRPSRRGPRHRRRLRRGADDAVPPGARAGGAGPVRQPGHQGGERLRRPHRRPQRPGGAAGGHGAHPPRPGLRVRPAGGAGSRRGDVRPGGAAGRARARRALASGAPSPAQLPREVPWIA